jgi:hypothetical protein
MVGMRKNRIVHIFWTNLIIICTDTAKKLKNGQKLTKLMILLEMIGENFPKLNLLFFVMNGLL